MVVLNMMYVSSTRIVICGHNIQTYRHRYADVYCSRNADLWSHVIKSACPGDGSFLAGIDGQPKVCQLDLFLGRQQDVLRLDVPVNDALHNNAININRPKISLISALFTQILKNCPTHQQIDCS